MKGAFTWNPDRITGAFTLTKNRKIWAKTKGRCCYCGIQTLKVSPEKRKYKHIPSLATIEHVIPKHCGGTNAGENLLIACNKCNTRRGHLPLREFKKIIGKDFYYKELLIDKITHCPVCKDVELAMSIQPMKNDKGELRLRPLKKPFLRCALLACRRIINTENGDVWNETKLEIRG